MRKSTINDLWTGKDPLSKKIIGFMRDATVAKRIFEKLRHNVATITL